MKCSICFNSKFITLQYGVRDSKSHNIIKCKNCNHVQLDPIFTLEEYDQFYDKNLQSKNIGLDLNISNIKNRVHYDVTRRIKLINSFAPKNCKILEIGPGPGILLKELKLKGFDVCGFEISTEQRKLSKKHTDVKILDVDLRTNIPKIEKFDLICMFQVLEHIDEPIRFLNNVKKLLKNNGTLIIEVPNLNDFVLKSNQKYAEWYWQKAHNQYFTPDSLEKTIKSAGFKKIELIGTQRYSIENMFHWKLNNSPQLNNPTFNLPVELDWIEIHYKNFLEKKLICDTIVSISKIA